MSTIMLSVDITGFSLTLRSQDNCRSPRSVGAVLTLHENHDCLLELDVGVDPYAIPFHVSFTSGRALLSDGTPMPDGCGAIGFVAPFESTYEDIEPVPASLTARVSLPEADFEALWSTLATGRPDLMGTLSSPAGLFEHVLPPAWRWNTWRKAASTSSGQMSRSDCRGSRNGPNRLARAGWSALVRQQGSRWDLARLTAAVACRPSGKLNSRRLSETVGPTSPRVQSASTRRCRRGAATPSSKTG